MAHCACLPFAYYANFNLWQCRDLWPVNQQPKRFSTAFGQCLSNVNTMVLKHWREGDMWRRFNNARRCILRINRLAFNWVACIQVFKMESEQKKSEKTKPTTAAVLMGGVF
tara:strand:+ start:454 stop:786 length:333 start_codon:yes stop_codon:yes gene_type:complete